MSIALFICVHLRNLRPIPSCVLRDSVPQWQPFGLFEDEHEDDDEDDPQSSYFPLNSALRFSRKAFMPSFWSSDPKSK